MAFLNCDHTYMYMSNLTCGGDVQGATWYLATVERITVTIVGYRGHEIIYCAQSLIPRAATK